MTKCTTPSASFPRCKGRQVIALQTAVDTDGVLASQSTLCRFEQQADRDWAVTIHEEMIKQFIRSFRRPPKKPLYLDFDAADDRVHGQQRGRHLNGYYVSGHSSTSGLTLRCLTGEERRQTAPSSGAASTLRRVLELGEMDRREQRRRAGHLLGQRGTTELDAGLLQASMLLATVLTTFLSPLFIAVMGLDVAGAAYANAGPTD